MSTDYVCEQCGATGALCVSGWGYIAALCDECLSARQSYLKLPEPPGPAREAVDAAQA